MPNTSVVLPGWILATQWASRGVLIVLVILSIWSVAIMVDRFRVFGGTEQLRGALDDARRLIADRNWAGLRDWTMKSSADASALSLRLPAGALKAALETGSGASAENVDR